MHPDHFDGGPVHVDLDPARQQADPFGIAWPVDAAVGLIGYFEK